MDSISTEGFIATAGRQRINWGQTFVWNVNDVFNAYSYFDFDYKERPGRMLFVFNSIRIILLPSNSQ